MKLNFLKTSVLSVLWSTALIIQAVNQTSQAYNNPTENNYHNKILLENMTQDLIKEMDLYNRDPESYTQNAFNSPEQREYLKKVCNFLAGWAEFFSQQQTTLTWPHVDYLFPQLTSLPNLLKNPEYSSAFLCIRMV